MNKISFSSSVVLLVWTLVGCGSKSEEMSHGPSAPSTGSQPANPQPTQPATIEAPPDLANPVHADSAREVVLAFLNGMRDGDSGTTARLLTVNAQQETVKHNWPVQPPGAPSATYQLGQAAFMDQQRTAAQIPCVWSEPDSVGGTIRFEVAWMLRRQIDGWRIAGFSSEIVPGRPAYFFNFEDIANLKAAQADAEAALAQLTQAGEYPPSVAENPNPEKTLR